MNGEEGNDILDARDGSKIRAAGGPGDDTIHGNEDDVKLNGDGGNDTIHIEGGSTTTGKYSRNIAKSFSHLSVADGDSAGLYISDDSGIDTLSFSNFDQGIKLDLSIMGSKQIYTSENDTITLNSVFEYFVGSPYDDVISIDPDNASEKNLDGGGSSGSDTLYVDHMGAAANDNGQTVTVTGYLPVHYANFDQCILARTLDIDYLNSPSGFRLNQNYPNPFNPTTTISYEIPIQTNVGVTIYNLNGRQIQNYSFENLATGLYQINWNGRNHMGIDVPGGIYFYKINAGDYSETKKMLLLK